MDDLQCMTTEEVAKYLRVNKATIQRAVRMGQLPHVRVGRQYRFPKFVIDAYLKGPDHYKKFCEEE